MVGYNVHPFIFQKQLSKSNEVLPPHRIPTYQFCSHFMLPICSLHFDVTTSRYPDPGHINHVSYRQKQVNHKTPWNFYRDLNFMGDPPKNRLILIFYFRNFWTKSQCQKMPLKTKRLYIYLIHVKPHHVS